MDFNIFDTDREEVIERAREAGVSRILNPGIDLASSRVALAIAEEYPEVFASVGIHPNSALSWDNYSLDELEGLASHPKVVAIGEIGLDYYRDRAPRKLQLEVLQHQLDLAARMKLPVVIHNRQATDDIISVLHEWCLNLRETSNPLWKQPGVLHSFSEDEVIAKQAISDLFMIGITGPVTFKNAHMIQNTVLCTSIENLLIETDAPFLTPHPFRGSRNEPAHVRLVADKIAQIKDIPLQVVKERTTTNADKLFSWRESG